MSMNRRDFLRLSGASALGLAVLALPEAARAALATLRPTVRCLPGDHEVVLTGPDGRVQRLGGLGTGPGRFNYPCAAAVDGAGRLHVLDRGNARVQVFDATGTWLSAFPVGGGARDLALAPSGLVGVVQAGGWLTLYREGRQVARAEGLGRLVALVWTDGGWHALDADGRRVCVLDDAARVVRTCALPDVAVPCALAVDAAGAVAVLDGMTGVVHPVVGGAVLAALPAGTRRFLFVGSACVALA